MHIYQLRNTFQGKADSIKHLKVHICVFQTFVCSYIEQHILFYRSKVDASTLENVYVLTNNCLSKIRSFFILFLYTIAYTYILIHMYTKSKPKFRVVNPFLSF